jgi:hypothetical protein
MSKGLAVAVGGGALVGTGRLCDIGGGLVGAICAGADPEEQPARTRRDSIRPTYRLRKGIFIRTSHHAPSTDDIHWTSSVLSVRSP